MDCNRNIEVLYKEPNKNPERRKIANTLEEMQNVVGGYIEIVGYKGALLICNEEGKLRGLEPNISLGDDIICGSFFIAGDDYEKADFISLTESQFEEFMKEFSNALQCERELEEELE